MDNVKKVGKNLAEDQKKSTHAAKTFTDNDFLIDKVRDYLTPNHPFEMEFSTYNQNDNTKISLNFSDKIVGIATPCGDCGKPPAPINCAIADNFNRDDQVGFGTSLNVGGVYDLSWTPDVHYGTTNISKNRGKLVRDGPGWIDSWASETLNISKPIIGDTSDILLHFYLDFNLWDLYTPEFIWVDFDCQYSQPSGEGGRKEYTDIHLTLEFEMQAYLQLENITHRTRIHLFGNSITYEWINMNWGSEPIYDVKLEANTWYALRLRVPQGWYPTAKIWKLGEEEPIEPTITGEYRASIYLNTLESFTAKLSGGAHVSSTRTMYIDNLEIPDIDNCGDCVEGGITDITICPEGVVLDSFSRSTGQYYDICGINPAMTDGWGTGERLAWTSSGSNVHHYVDGGQGIFWLSQALYPLLVEATNGYKTATAIIPEDVEKVNIFIQFGILRFLRLYPPYYVGPYVAGKNILPEPDEYFKWIGSGDGCWQVVNAGVAGPERPGDVVVVEYGVLAYGSSSACPSTIGMLYFGYLGPNQACNEQTTTGEFYQNNGYGFVGYLDRYGSEYFVPGGGFDNLMFKKSSEGIFYVPGHGFKSIWAIDQDINCVAWDNTFHLNVTIGNHTFHIGRDSGGLNIPNIDCVQWPPPINGGGLMVISPEGFSSPAFGVNASHGSSGFKTTGAKVIEPNYTYNMRIYKPNAKTSMIKVWESWAQEPKDWLATHIDDGWDTTPVDTRVGHEEYITIEATGALWQTSMLAVSNIVSCPSNAGVDDPLPTNITTPAIPNANYQEILTGDLISSDFNEETGQITWVWSKNFQTWYPYIPGTLSVYYNCFRLSKGSDYTEVDPALGTFLMSDTAPPVTHLDRLFIRYKVASTIPT